MALKENLIQSVTLRGNINLRLHEIRAVLFDWDGVLLNSLEANIRVYNKILLTIGLRKLDRGKFLKLQSPNWYLFYERLGIPRKMWKTVDKQWLRLYASERPRLHSDVKTVLGKLRKIGLKMGLVTNGKRSRVEKELDAFGLRSFLDSVVFTKGTQEFKPSPLMLIRALKELRTAASRSIYVGDSPEDILAAKAAGMKTVAISRGLSDEVRLRNEAPDYVFASLHEMMQSLF